MIRDMIKISNEPFTQREVDTVVRWLNDRTLMKYSEQRHTVHTQASQLRYINSFKEPDQYKKINFETKLIGTVSAYVDTINDIANVGILIGGPHGGNGYGEEAWRIFCNDLGVRKIEAGCMAQNKPMIRVFEKNHMRLEGTRRAHFDLGKGVHDHLVLYGMFP